MRDDLRLRIVATQIHINCGSTFPDLTQLTSWCERTLDYGDHILIATDDLLYQSIRQIYAHFERVHALHIGLEYLSKQKSLIRAYFSKYGGLL